VAQERATQYGVCVIKPEWQRGGLDQRQSKQGSKRMRREQNCAAQARGTNMGMDSIGLRSAQG
jgi:hypothetical protein